MGLGWSHPNYGRSIGSGGVWSEGYFSSIIFKIKNTKINSINVYLNQVFTNKIEDLKIIVRQHPIERDREMNPEDNYELLDKNLKMKYDLIAIVLTFKGKLNDNFFKITGKERFKIENTIKRNSSKVSKEFIIDAKNKKILKVEKGKIFVVRSFTESVYV